MEWIKKIVPSLGLLIGIILTSIGATMALSSGLKLAFSQPVIYDYTYACQTKYEPTLQQNTALEEKDRVDCEVKTTAKETARFKTEKTQNILDGIAFLVVGIFFWVWFTRKHKA